MARQIALGSEFYLWQSEGARAPNLLVTSHGAYMPRPEFGKSSVGGFMNVPAWTTLHFYGPHQHSLIDPGISKVISGGLKVYESAPSGAAVRNYRLSKYQGRHGNENETYQSIRHSIDNNRMFEALRQEALASADPEKLRYVQRVAPNAFPAFDVLTVRNRWWMGGMGATLRELLQELSRAGHRYPNVHCVFCRSRLIGSSGTWRAT